MNVPRGLVLAAALALAGCVTTSDEPFSLDDSDAVPSAPGVYVCVPSADAKATLETKEARLILIRKNKRSQYLFVDGADASAEPFTFHRVKQDLYVAAAAHSDGPGEDFYIVAFRSAGAEFSVYVEADDLATQAQGLARQHGVTLKKGQFSNDLGGPIGAQKAFMIATASDLKGWRIAVDCRAKL